MKQSILFFAICTMFLYSCDKNDTAEGKAPGVLYLSENGVNKLTSYDVGEMFEKEIWVGKGGLSGTSIPYRIELASQWLDSVNGANGTSFQLLPADSYELIAEADAIGGIWARLKPYSAMTLTKYCRIQATNMIRRTLCCHCDWCRPKQEWSILPKRAFFIRLWCPTRFFRLSMRVLLL